MSRYVVWFEDYRDSDRPRVGGKNASLGEMMRVGLPVPPGFAVTTEAYHTLREHSELRAKVNRTLKGLDLNDTAALRRASDYVRRLIESTPLEPEVENDVRDAYAELCERCQTTDVPVAVRSSATAEDLPDASFAGQQDTFLWVTGADAVIDSLKRCWSSVFTDRAISYRRRMGHDHEVVSMAVGIQKMVLPKAAGVAFTLNPTDGDRSQVAIDASWGFGEAVVSGDVTPDNYLVDKVLMEIVNRTISPKAVEYRLNGRGTVERHEVEPERACAPCLTDAEIKAVAALAKRAEKSYGCPQDVEWAIDAHLPPDENVVMLQSRPETVWSRKPRTAARPASGNPMDSIVATLLSPIHARGATTAGSPPDSGATRTEEASM